MKSRRLLPCALTIVLLQLTAGLSSGGLDVRIRGRTDDLESALPRLAPELVRTWVERTSELLALDRDVPHAITVIFVDELGHPAETLGTTIRVSRDVLKRTPGDHGLLVHELVHVLQAYPPQKAPGWITEGIADWIRYYHFESQRGLAYFRTGADPTWGGKDVNYTAGYLPAAAFLEYLRRECDPNLLWRLNAALRAGQYTDDFFARRGIADLDGAWREFTSRWSAPTAGGAQGTGR